MKKFFVVFLALVSVSCIQQTIHTEAMFLDHYDYEEVWMASIRAVNDIGFTVYSVDKASGFIGAESGRHVGQEMPPLLSIMIEKSRGRMVVQCKVLQKEFVDVFGHGRRITRNFMVALNRNIHLLD
ncbi:MAG: hypothetical protein WCC06_03590 [Candidatus Aminicenantales bacterium]